jgi:serine/threonine protein phosphatase 1
MPSTQHGGRPLPAGVIEQRPRVPAGTRVYAIGDIHGRLDLLLRLHDTIRRDAETSGAARRIAVYLGDYIDRGPDSYGVVDLLLAQPLEGFEHIYLKGNHEELLLRFVTDGGLARSWLGNGGGPTLKSYGVSTLGILLGHSGLERMRTKLERNIPDGHRAFYRDLELSHMEGDYLFVHAGVRPGVPLDQQEAEDLMWIRQDFLNAEDDFGKIVVHGHSITNEPEIKANRIGIDTGAFRSDCLTCLVLDGATRRFLDTSGPT